MLECEGAVDTLPPGQALFFVPLRRGNHLCVCFAASPHVADKLQARMRGLRSGLRCCEVWPRCVSPAWGGPYKRQQAWKCGWVQR